MKKSKANESDKLAKAKEEAARALKERINNQLERISTSNTFKKSPNKQQVDIITRRTEEEPLYMKKQPNKRKSTPTRKTSQPKKSSKSRNSTPTRKSSRRMETSSSSRSEEEEEENELIQKESTDEEEEDVPVKPPVRTKKIQKRKRETPVVTESVYSSSTSSTPPPSLIIGIAQITSTADISQNMKICFDAIKTAAEQNIQFLFFPEGFYYMGNALTSSKLSDLKPFGLKIDSPFISQICDYAKEYSMWISLGGFPEIIDNNNICNTHIVINLQGYVVSIYRQVHTLPSSCYTPGNNMVVLGIDDYKFALSIGNDIYYPNLYRQLRIKGHADFLIIPSSLNDDLGEDQWMNILKTRAIENQCIVIAANQVGKNYKGYKSYGHSVIVAPDGKLLNAPNTIQGVVVVRVDLTSTERERSYNRIDNERNDVYNGIVSPSC